jgi:hypothetical protein
VTFPPLNDSPISSPTGLPISIHKIFTICKNNTLTLNRFRTQIKQQVKEMTKQKYYGKETHKEKYPYKKKEKSKGKYQ